MSMGKQLFHKDERLAIDSDSGIPLYRQIEERMVALIAESGQADSFIPTDEELTEIFGVSRITVRKAVESLVSKGLLGRRRGVGTRILRTRMVEDLGRLRSFTEEAESEGFEVVTKVLGVRKMLPRRDVRAALRLKQGERALRLYRVRGTNAVFPIFILESFFPERTGMDEHENFSLSTYDLLTKKHKVPMLWARQRITAHNASPEEAKLLQVKTGVAVLVFFRTTYGVGDEPIEFARGVFNPRLYSFSISLQR